MNGTKIESYIEKLKGWYDRSGHNTDLKRIDANNQYLEVTIPDPQAPDTYVYRHIHEFDGTGFLMQKTSLHKTPIEPNLDKDIKLF